MCVSRFVVFRLDKLYCWWSNESEWPPYLTHKLDVEIFWLWKQFVLLENMYKMISVGTSIRGILSHFKNHTERKIKLPRVLFSIMIESSVSNSSMPKHELGGENLFLLVIICQLSAEFWMQVLRKTYSLNLRLFNWS